jgi:soluble P-type ATPase
MSLTVAIPGGAGLELRHLVLDYNGTVALDGHLAEGVARRLEALGEKLETHVLTADTFGRAKIGLGDLKCRLVILEPGGEDRKKAEYVDKLGAGSVVAIGNGRNDRLMLERAALAIAVLGPEGLSAEALSAADILVADPIAALELLLNPRRIAATLRS